MLITIDGPAGSGKSTTARLLARALNINYLDTGAGYRAVTLAALRAGIEPTQLDALADLLSSLRFVQEGERFHLNGEDVSAAIRTKEIDARVSFFAQIKQVRDRLTQDQQLAARHTSMVTDGRDQGSVVFPDADFKFFLIADEQVRADRTATRQAACTPHAVDRAAVAAQQRQRDQLDSSRDLAPLLKPKGAIEIDSSNRTPEQVVEEMLFHIRKASANSIR